MKMNSSQSGLFCLLSETDGTLSVLVMILRFSVYLGYIGFCSLAKKCTIFQMEENSSSVFTEYCDMYTVLKDLQKEGF